MALVYNMRALAQSDGNYVYWGSSAPDPTGTNAPEAIVIDTATIISISGEDTGGGGGDSIEEINWVRFTPVVHASTTDPTFGQIEGLWRREGDSMRIHMICTHTLNGQGGSGYYFFELPDGYTIDLTKVNQPTDAALFGLLGRGLFWDRSSSTPTHCLHPGWNFAFSSIMCAVESSNSSLSSNVPTIPSLDDWFQLNFLVPIQGW